MPTKVRNIVEFIFGFVGWIFVVWVLSDLPIYLLEITGFNGLVENKACSILPITFISIVTAIISFLSFMTRHPFLGSGVLLAAIPSILWWFTAIGAFCGGWSI